MAELDSTRMFCQQKENQRGGTAVTETLVVCNSESGTRKLKEIGYMLSLCEIHHLRMNSLFANDL